MKKIMLALFMVFLVIPVTAHPSGKLIFTPSYFTEHEKVLPAVGLGIYEPIALGVYYDGYNGIGISPREKAENVSWMVSRHDIGMDLGDLDLSVGVALKLSQQRLVGAENESNIHITVKYTLWD